MRIDLALLVASLILVLPAESSFSHHSFTAEYDSAKLMQFTGTVTKVEWTNPHARFYIDVKDQSGNMINWNLELASPNGLMRQGWTRHSLKVGDVVTVTGALAKDGSNMANARTVTLADGRKVFAGTSGDGGPTQ